MASELVTTSLLFDANLKAYYRMESGLLTTDSSGNSRTLTNVNTVGETTGQFFGACDSGATNSTKKFTIASNLDIANGSVTINCWFNSYAGTFAGDHPPLVSQFSDATGGYAVAHVIGIGTTGLFAARLKSGIAWQETSQVAISSGTWQMASMTYNGTHVKLYLNGSLQGSVAASGTGSPAYADQTALFCHAGYTADVFTSAKLDDISFFNRALTDTELTDLYSGWPSSSSRRLLGVGA